MGYHTPSSTHNTTVNIVCTDTHVHTDRRMDKQTDRQTDRYIHTLIYQRPSLMNTGHSSLPSKETLYIAILYLTKENFYMAIHVTNDRW